MPRPPEYQQWVDRAPKAVPWPPKPIKNRWLVSLFLVALLCAVYVLVGCSSALPANPLTALPPKQACQVMAALPLASVTDPDLVNLGDLKALTSRLKACNAQPDGGL